MKLHAVFVLLLLLSFELAAGPVPPPIDARAYFLVDAATGKILVKKNENLKLSPASITKIMTSIIVFDKIKTGELSMDENVIISKKAARMKGSRMFIRENSEVSVKDLLYGMIVSSGNDASIALAEHVAGTEEAFADIMNEYGLKLGMKNTHFVNSTGWPDANHYTSVHDIALMSTALISNFPGLYKIYAQKKFTYGKDPKGRPITQNNRNRLLNSDIINVDGIKTGHTNDAGYCLAASAVEDDMRLISVVMGAKSKGARTRQSQRLLTYGFRNFETNKLFSKEQVLKNVRIWKGDRNEIELGTLNDLYITARKRKPSLVDDVAGKRIRIISDTPLIAPVKKGDRLGVIMVTQQGELVGEFPLVVLEDVDESNFLSQMWDSLLMNFSD